MSPFWRKFYKGMFYASIVVSFIIVLVLGVLMIRNDNPMGWLVILAGGFLVIGAHALIGALLEMMYNIAALKEKFCGEYIPDIRDEDDTEDDLDTEMAEKEYMICPRCKKLITNGTMCRYCGYEVSSSADSANSKYIPWKCPKCKTDNAGENQYCTNCGFDIDSQT